jgi:predicted GTPase
MFYLQAKSDKLVRIAMSSANCPIVVLGCQGAGKSTLVNDLMGQPVADVGPNMLKDGTVAVSSHLGRYNIIDTPGLNSEYPVSGGQIRSELSKLQSKQFLALLVLDACTSRFVGHERKKLTEICVHFKHPMKFVVVRSKSNLLKQPGLADKVRELKNGDFFPGNALFEHSSIRAILHNRKHSRIFDTVDERRRVAF